MFECIQQSKNKKCKLDENINKIKYSLILIIFTTKNNIFFIDKFKRIGCFWLLWNKSIGYNRIGFN